MFINGRKRNANTYLISNFDSLEAGGMINILYLNKFCCYQENDGG